MNNYRVQIRSKEECSTREVVAHLLLSEKQKNSGIIDYFTHGIDYINQNEHIAMKVYAKAKRNLDLSKFTVTLELPKK